MKRIFQVAAMLSALVFANFAHAGVDIFGVVSGIQVAPDGTLWFSVSPGGGSQLASAYCASHWDGLNIYVPAGDPNYAYYYGLLLTSMTKSRAIYLGNISIYNGSTSCDITKTGYGIVLN